MYWNGTAEALYTLGTNGATSSELAVAGALTKSGSGSYVLNFQGTRAAGNTYTLATFISGTPSSAGTYAIAIGATNGGGTGSSTLTIIISAAVSPDIPAPQNFSKLAAASFR